MSFSLLSIKNRSGVNIARHAAIFNTRFGIFPTMYRRTSLSYMQNTAFSDAGLQKNRIFFRPGRWREGETAPPLVFSTNRRYINAKGRQPGETPKVNAHLSTYATAAKRFIETQLLDMRWLDEGVASTLLNCGLDPVSPLGATTRLIVFSIIRLTLLLVALSILRGVLNLRFEPERNRRALFGGALTAASAGVVTGAALLKSAEATLPSRFAALVKRGIAPEAAAAILFAAPFADPATALVVLTIAFGIKSALVCTLSGVLLALAGGVLIGRIRRHCQDTAAPPGTPPDAGKTPGLRALPGRVLCEVRYVFPYIVLGSGAGAFIRNWVPESWIQTLLGSTDPRAVGIAVTAGIPFGADIFCMLPIVVELHAKGAQPGVLAAFVLSATAFTPSALFAFKRAVKPGLLILMYVLCLIWAAGIGCLLDALPEALK